ncbi:hypothetical protein PVK06_043673 [Gossypium arboreum]|uniref:Uncharacterized protein n=1 Tax=Gossypium arboreum TaxID=29729 RepID=A0ABR0MP86_GOSAR|nr:hypothetical protein PVK06_043673 [Gossypium arboreum]
MHDVPNLDLEKPCFIIDPPELDNNSQQKFGIEDNGDELNMTKVVSDPTDIESNITVDVAIDVKVEVTTNMELKSILNGGVEELIHLLAIVEKLLVEEIDEFDKGKKA